MAGGCWEGVAQLPGAPASDVIDWQPAMLTSSVADDHGDGKLRGEPVWASLLVRCCRAFVHLSVSSVDFLIMSYC